VLLDKSSDLNEHRSAKDFGIPPSKEFDSNIKDSIDFGIPSGTIPLNELFERSIVIRDGNIERLGNVPVIWLLLKLKSCSEYLAQPDNLRKIVEMFSFKLLSARFSECKLHMSLMVFIVPSSSLLDKSSFVKLEVALNTHSNIFDDEKVFSERSRIVRERENFNSEGDRERR
jgi:hypothetical protein